MLLGTIREPPTGEQRQQAAAPDVADQEAERPLRSNHGVADINSMVRYDTELVDPTEVETTGEGGLSFAVFSLAHAACGDDVVEVRIGERILLEWCMACAVMEVFGSAPVQTD